MDKTKIEWSDATWNIINGCSLASPGCTNCYAMRLAGTRLKHHPTREGLTVDTKAGPVWNGKVHFVEQAYDQPERWRKPRRIFVCAHGDLFHPAVPREWIDRVFSMMARCSQHTFQVLTKRPERMRDYIREFAPSPASDGFVTRGGVPHNRSERGWPIFSPKRWPLPNVWLGTSVEDQRRADERIPILLNTAAAVRWVSMEPLLGPVNLKGWIYAGFDGDRRRGISAPNVRWVVLGGESGPGARPMHPDWARSVRDQCATAGVPFLFKQWGEFAPLRVDLIPTPRERQAWVHVDGARVVRVKVEDDLVAMGLEEDEAGRNLFSQMLRVGKKRAGRLLDGVEHNGYPEGSRS